MSPVSRESRTPIFCPGVPNAIWERPFFVHSLQKSALEINSRRFDAISSAHTQCRQTQSCDVKSFFSLLLAKSFSTSNLTAKGSHFWCKMEQKQ